MKLFLTLMLLCSCKTQSKDSACFKQPYITIVPSEELAGLRREQLEDGVHFWNVLGAKVRLDYEDIPQEEEYCLNIIGDQNTVYMGLGDTSEDWVGVTFWNFFADQPTITLKRESWNTFTNPGCVHLAAHEVGHALKMEHTEDLLSIMYPYASDYLVLTKEDIDQFLNAWDPSNGDM